jgi:hypothetical protein
LFQRCYQRFGGAYTGDLLHGNLPKVFSLCSHQ